MQAVLSTMPKTLQMLNKYLLFQKIRMKSFQGINIFYNGFVPPGIHIGWPTPAAHPGPPCVSSWDKELQKRPWLQQALKDSD